MSTINITKARQNLFQLVTDVNIGFNPISIVNSKGKNAVLISEDEWKNIEETLYLSSIPGMADHINEVRKKEDWKTSTMKMKSGNYRIKFSKQAEKDKKKLSNKNSIL